VETDHSCLWALCEGNLEWGTFPEDPEGYVEKALETGISLYMGPAGESGMGLICQGILEMDEGDCRSGASLREFWEGNLMGGFITGNPRRYVEKVLGTGISIGPRWGTWKGALIPGTLKDE